MNISSTSSSLNPLPGGEPISRVQSPHQASERTKLIEAVQIVNDSNALGENNELTFAFDRTSRNVVVRIIDRQTQDVVLQIPSESVLRLAEQIKQNSSA